MQSTIESLTLERNAYAAHCRELEGTRTALLVRIHELEEVLRRVSTVAVDALSDEPEPDVATQGTLVEIDLLVCEVLGLLAPPSQEKPK